MDRKIYYVTMMWHLSEFRRKILHHSLIVYIYTPQSVFEAQTDLVNRPHFLTDLNLWVEAFMKQVRSESKSLL